MFNFSADGCGGDSFCCDAGVLGSVFFFIKPLALIIRDLFPGGSSPPACESGDGEWFLGQSGSLAASEESFLRVVVFGGWFWLLDHQLANFRT